MAAQVAIYAAMAGMQLLSGIQQANNIQKQAELQKKIDDFNIEQTRLDEFNAEADGYTQLARYQSVIDETLAAQKVGYTAQGVDANFGSAKDIQEQSSVNSQLNKIDIIAAAHMKALGFQNQVNNMKLQSNLNSLAADTQAASVRGAAILNAAGTGVKGAESAGVFSSAKPIQKPDINFGQPVKGGADNFNYNAYYGWSGRNV